jgi:hypothetical protein
LSSHIGLRVADSVVYQKLNDEMVLLNLDSQNYYSLDDVATHMWDALMKLGTIEAAAGALTKKFDVAPEVLGSDLEDLVNKLIEAGLLVNTTS